MKSHQFKRIYLISFIISITSLIAGYYVAIFQLNKNAHQGNIINLAGRQRMLSQRITHLSIQLVHLNNPKAASELTTALKSWNQTHHYLITQTSLSSDKHQFEIKNMLEGVSPVIKSITINANILLTQKDGLDKVLDNIITSQSTFLISMDDIVMKMASINDENVSVSHNLIGIIICLIIFLLSLEISIIYLPILKKIAVKEIKLLNKNVELKQINKELTQMKFALEATNSLAILGGWEVNLLTGKINWTSITKKIHELPDDYEPNLEEAIYFYKEGQHRNNIALIVDDAIKQGKTWDEEAILVTAKGNERWVRSLGQAEMKDGKCIRIFGTVQDIHEKKLQTLQLAESEERYRSLIDNTMYAVILASEDCNIISSNPATENMFQYASGELKEMHFFQLFENAMPGFIKKVMSEKPDNLLEWNGRKKNGELFACKIEVNTFTDSLGKQNLIITIKDNSAYKKIVVEHAIIEKRLQSILDNAPVAIYIKDMDGRYLMVNKEAEHIIQQPIESIIGKKDIDFLPLEISKLIEKADIELVRTGKSFSYEETMPVAGINSISQITKFLIKDENDIATAIGAIAWDITEKRMQEQQILDAATIVQKLTEKVNIGIFQLRSDVEGEFHFDFLSRGFENICPGVNLIAATKNVQILHDLIHPADLKNVIESTIYSRANLTDWSMEFRWIIDDKIKWIDASSKPERKPDGSTVWYGYMEDVTLHRQELERLRLMESVVTNMQDMVMITEAEPFELPGPKILYVNDAYTQITGFSREESIGNTPRKLQGPKSDRTALNNLFTALKNWQTHTVEIINYRKDGKEFWNNFTVMPIADEKGWYTHWVSIQRDVTQTKEYIISIEKKNKRLEEIAWAQSHLVRAPLANLMALVNVLENYPKEDTVKLLQLIKEAAAQLDKIIGDIVKMTADFENTQ